MFKSDDDIKKALNDIRRLKDMLDANINNPAVKGSVPRAVKEELDRLKLSLNFFSEFNLLFLKSLGYDDQELTRSMQLRVPGRDPKAEALFQEADRLRCELILSQARFIRKHFKDYLEGNRPFVAGKTTDAQKKVTKKKMKKKFKSMKERMKWQKM